MNRWVLLIVAAVCLTSHPETASPQSPNEIRESDLFEAQRTGLIEVSVIPRDYWRLVVKIENQSDQSLKIQLPKVYAAVPLIKVAGSGGSGGSLGDSSGGVDVGEENYSQGLGSTFVRTGSRRGRRDNVVPATTEIVLEPGRSFRETFDCFCLEFGKPDPTPKIPYELLPLEQLNPKPEVRRLMELYVDQNLDQRITQLAAWRLANAVDWNVLAAMPNPRSSRRAPLFQTRELQQARELLNSFE